MSGFSSIIGFMLTFFVIVGVFFGAFYSYQSQIISQAQTMESFEKQMSSQVNYDLEFNEFYFSSDKLYILMDNKGTQDVKFVQDGDVCIDVFIDEKYYSLDDLKVSVDKSIIGDYYVLERGTTGVLSVDVENLDLSSSHRVKVVGCNGQKKELILNNDNIDWWDDNYLSRKNINVQNPDTGDDIEEYQVLVRLNYSNFDFMSSQDELRFELDFKQNTVLDISFDEYEQVLDDHSRYSNDVYLGAGFGVDIDDPVSVKGVIFDALEFDGVDDRIRVQADRTLELYKEFSFSTFVKWDETGSSMQYILFNGNDKNSVAIVNDGGVNDNKIRFNLDINGNGRVLYSNALMDNDWHLVTCVYNGEDMQIFIDDKLDNSYREVGEIWTSNNDNYIGSSDTGNYFKGIIDEVKMFNLALELSEVEDIFNNQLRFRDLDFYVVNYDESAKLADIFVKVPLVFLNDDVNISFYSDSSSVVSSMSSIEDTFTYNSANRIGNVLSDRISGVTGLSIFSLEDDNTIIIGDDEFNLDYKQGATLSTADFQNEDFIYMKKLAQLEGGGNADDIIAPISWAGTEFYFRGFRDTVDRFCMAAPFEDANVELFDGGVSEFTGLIDDRGGCIDADITTNNGLAIVADNPILVYYFGGNDQDSFVFYPATNEKLYGSPSQTIYVAAGISGASVDYYRSSGSSSVFNLGSYGTSNVGSNGGNGDSDGYVLISDEKIGAIQQADGDGTESTVFVEKKDFGTFFGSNHDTDYLSIVSDFSDANCTLYDSSDLVVLNVPTGTGSNGIYKYNFDVGNNNLLVSGGWSLECDKPVWPYYENTEDAGDETNLFGYSQMRQYNYPEPVVTIS